MTDLFAYLSNNSYPGRGIAVGSYKDEPVIVYFIMGRSENSRNRVFRMEDGVLFTKAYDESKVKDPSLIMYNALKEHWGVTVVTNGDQTDTVADALEKGISFEKALESRQYEPDAPNYTPRISAALYSNRYEISILKKKGEECERILYPYAYENGKGRFISTYDHDGDPLPSFSKDPLEFAIEEDFEEFAKKCWKSLNYDNKVSLYVSFGNRHLIFNKKEEENA